MRPLLVILFLSITGILSSQELSFKEYTTHDGLKQMQIIGISEDTLGNLLLSTKAGLSRFNGETFDNYDDIECLPGYVNHTIRGSDGFLYLLTTKKFIRFDGDSCMVYDLPDNTKMFLQSMIVEYLPGVFIIGIADDYKRKPLFFKDSKFYEFSDVLPGYNHDKAWGYAREGDTLYVASPDRDSIFIYHEFNLIQTIPTELFAFFSTNKMDGSFLNFPAFLRRVGDGHGGYEMFRVFKDGRIEHNCAFTDPLEHGHVPCKYPHDLYRRVNTPQVDLMMPFQKEIYRINKAQEKWGVLWSINRQGDGSIIFQGERGLSLLDNEYFFTIPEEELPGIWSVIENDKGEMLFGGFRKGILKNIAGDYILQPVTNPHDKNKTIPPHQSGIYFGPSLLNGSVYWPGAGGLIKEGYPHYKFIYEYSIYDPKYWNSAISSFADESLNQLVLSGCDGVRFFDPVKEKTVRIIAKDRIHCESCVKEGVKDRNGDYWFVCGYRAARYKYDLDSLSIYSVGSNAKSNFISAEMDTEGRLWFGSRDGLYYYDEIDDKLKKYPVCRNVPISALHAYDDEKMFASAGNDFVMFNPSAYFRDSTVQYKKYNHYNGFMGVEPNQTGLYLDSKDRLWITSATVLSYTYPKFLHYSDYSLTPRITHINGKRIPFSNPILQIEKGQNKVSFEYEAIGLRRPQKLYYSYRLDNGEWSPYSENKTGLLSNLSSGEHTIELRISGEDKTDFPTAKATFKANVPLTKEPYFASVLMVFSFLFIMAIVALGSFLRINQKEKELIELSLVNLKSQNQELISKVEGFNKKKTEQNGSVPDDFVLTVSLVGETRLIPINTIMYLKASGNYVEIMTTDNDKPLMPRGSLKAFSRQVLPTSIFVQVHRSYIVNLLFVHRVSRNEVVLRHEHEDFSVPVGTTYYSNIKNSIEQNA